MVLFPAICFKLYPAILLLLFFRRRLFQWVVRGAAGFFLVNGALMLALPGRLIDNVSRLMYEFDAYSQAYIIGQRGVSNSANAWNYFRICVWSAYGLVHGNFHWPMPEHVVVTALGIYYKIFFVVLSVVIVTVLVAETSFARRAVLLLLYMTIAAPGGGDYKLAYLNVALVIFILIPERRQGDLLITIGLALCLIPKREVLLTFFGISDSLYYDASLNVLTNPFCVVGAMILMIRDAWQAAAPIDWERRFMKFAHVLRLDEVRALFRPASRS
jgi:hypothetical protein